MIQIKINWSKNFTKYTREYCWDHWETIEFEVWDILSTNNCWEWKYSCISVSLSPYEVYFLTLAFEKMTKLFKSDSYNQSQEDGDYSYGS